MQCPEHHTKVGLWKVYYSEQLYLCSRAGLEAPAQVSEVYCVKNHIHSLLVCHYMNKLMARTGWGIGRRSAVVSGTPPPVPVSLGSFFPLMLLSSAFLHVAHPFGMRSVCEGDVASVTAGCLQSVVQLTAPCSAVYQKQCLFPAAFLAKRISRK